jgi:dGTP triphosphohydrolase
MFERHGDSLPFKQNEIEHTIEDLAEIWTDLGPYEGRSAQRKVVRTISSSFIGDYVCGVSCKWSDDRTEHVLQIPTRKLLEVFILKELTWHYVILRPSLTTQQAGQMHVIRSLFNVFKLALHAKSDSSLGIFPYFYREQLIELRREKKNPKVQLRVVVDLISSMTERQALTMFHQLTGSSLGSALSHPFR